MPLPRKARQGYYDLAYVLQIAGSDEPFVIEMLKYFVQNTPLVLDRLTRYTDEKDWDCLAAEAHKFAPGLHFLGIAGLEGPVRKVEDYAVEKNHLDKVPSLVGEIRQKGQEVVEMLINDFELQ